MDLNQLSAKDLEARVKGQEKKFWKIIKFVEATTKKLGKQTLHEVYPDWVYQIYVLHEFHGFNFIYEGQGYPRGDFVSISYQGKNVLRIDAASWRDEHWPISLDYYPGEWEQKLLDIIKDKTKYYQLYTKQLKKAKLEADKQRKEEVALDADARKKSELLERAQKLEVK